MSALGAFLAGLVFGVGLILSGMTDPGKVIGFLDIPLIHMSVYWWRTLHQPPSILRPDKLPWENVHPAMLTALVINFVGFLLLYFYLLSLRLRLGEVRRLLA